MNQYYRKPNLFIYRLTQGISSLVQTIIFKRKFIRNELKGKKGPIIVIANHQAALDFINLIGATKEPMSFVISNSFYSTLPIKKMMDRVGVIPKQQFQTSINDMHMMKAVVEEKGILVIYPAGLMCEDGLSTPIPNATFRFLQWMHADVYMAKTYGTYFCTPKWSKKRRRGRTYLDVYKLFDKDELTSLPADELERKMLDALLFDAYREQEELKVPYKHGENVEGLENVLYVCPNCGREFTVTTKGSVISCTECGFAEESDKYGFLHKISDTGTEIRYVSDWSRKIYNDLKERIERGDDIPLSSKAKFMTVNKKKNKFVESGAGSLTYRGGHLYLLGKLNGESFELDVNASCFASLPFKPGKHIEVQHGKDIYRCVLEDGRLSMKFINLIKINHELFQASHTHN
jgi:predicted RNA-binding Zn-ribbon protein involved in translation (DUF1610 family)